MAIGGWFFLEGGVIYIAEKFSALNNCTLHFAPRTQLVLAFRFALLWSEFMSPLQLL